MTFRSLLLAGVASFAASGAFAQPADLSTATTTATGGMTARTHASRAADSVNVKDGYNGAVGAYGDALAPTSCQAVMTATSAALAASCATFTAADIGKTMVVSGAGTGGASLTALIAGFTDSHDVTLASTATLSTGTQTLAISSFIATAQSSTGSYAPGDTVTLSGGTSTAAAVLPITDTTVASSTVNAGGAGGTNGACTFVGTTGTGAIFTGTGTVTANALAGALVITGGGDYTVNPTSLAAEPITGCGLTGATVVLKMGILTLGVPTSPGNYSVQPSNPVSTTTSGSGTGATLTVNWATTGTFAYGHDDSAAFSNATAQARNALSNGPFPPSAQINVPQGNYLFVHPWDLTALQGEAMTISGSGASIICAATGIVCVDGLGSRMLKINDLAINTGLAAIPKIGLQIGRSNTAALMQADRDVLRNVTIRGYFSLSGFYNLNSETSYFDAMTSYNNLPGNNFYCAIQDGYNHFNAQSSFVTELAPVDTPQSFDENTYQSLDVRHTGGGPTIWVGNTNRHTLQGYSATIGAGNGAVIYAETSGGQNTQLNFDMHFETVGLTNVFFLTGNYTTPLLAGFRYRDQGNTASNSVFLTDTNITAVIMREADIEVASLQGGALLFANAALWTVTGHYFSQLITGFNTPASWAGDISVGQLHSLAFYGSAYLAAQMTDSTTIGGNARGPGAVDLSQKRGSATQVASGNQSTVLGGSNNTASGSQSIAGGTTTIASNTATVALGQQNTIAGTWSSAPGGKGVYDNARTGVQCFATNFFASLGDDQTCVTVLSQTSSAASAVRATADMGAASNFNCVNLPNNSTFSLIVTLLAFDHTTPAKSYSAVWGGGSVAPHILSRGATASTTLLDGVGTAVSPDATRSNGTLTGIAATLTADTTIGCLNVSFTPPTSNTDKWNAAFRVETVEVQ